MSFSEMKLDEIFPNRQFKIHGYKMYSEDRSKHSGGVLCYINEYIPCKMVSVEEVPNDCEIILIEFSVKTQTWLCLGLYRPPPQKNNYFLDNSSLILNKITYQFDRITFMENFNLTIENRALEEHI